MAARLELENWKGLRNTLNGYMAEALFLDKNADWNYVRKSNHPQYDVWRKNPTGKGNITGQIKYHANGKPEIYAVDMKGDNRAKYFFVPDDHVDSLKSHLKAKADQALAAGNKEEAARLYRDMNRVKGMGVSSTAIASGPQKAAREARFIRAAPYVFLGVAAILTIGPTAWEWYRGDIATTEAVSKLGKGGSTLLTGVVTDRALAYYRGGILRGTMRGNVLTAAAVLLVDTGWQVYESGGFNNAVQNPDFLMRFGGDVGATTCGLIGGTLGAEGGAAVGTSVGGPLGGTIGGIAGGIIVGTGSGMVGYWGGHEGTRWVLKKFAPEMLYEEENRYIKVVLKNIQKEIAEADTISNQIEMTSPRNGVAEPERHSIEPVRDSI
ncbi:MAG: hypothetical protein ACLP3B_07210 [Syntrophobacteraceae bacterium]